MKLRFRIVVAAILMLTVGMIASSNAAPIFFAGNGHYYDVIVSDLTWEQANNAANSLSNGIGSDWHLATITSQAEQAFVAGLVSQHNVPNGSTGFKLGGFQPSGSIEAAGGWQWVTGEAWNYTSWGSGEPNNVGAGGEAYLYMDERYSWGWNDYINSDAYYNPKGYVIEHDRGTPVPEPTTMILLGSGVVGLALVRRRNVQ